MAASELTRLFRNVMRTLKVEVPDPASRQRIYWQIIPAFEDANWEGHAKCAGEDAAYDAALRDLYGEAGGPTR